MTEDQDAIRRLRATLRAQILLTEAFATLLIDKGLIEPREIVLPWSTAELQVLDHELRELWDLARKRVAARKATGSPHPEPANPN